MIDNIQDMEWKDKDTLRTMVSKYNSNLNKISTEVNHIAKVSADSTVVSENTGYARVCEWKDGNRFEEERYGYFVEQSDDLRVTIANSDSAVLGVTARKPAFASNVTDNMYNRDELTANLCYVVLIGSTTVKQDGTITADTKYCINSNGIATASEGIGYKVTRVIDSENIVIEVSPATELIKQAYTELFNKIENKKAGLIEVDYTTWTNLSDEERVALGDVIVPNYPIDYSLEDVKKNVDKLSTDVTEIKSTIENGDFGSAPCTCAKYLKVNEETNFVYDSAITTTIVDGVLKNVFNADENLSIYKDRDETKFSLGTITYTSAVEVDLRIEDDNAWRWYCILPISAEQSIVDLTTVEWVLSGYQPNHEDTEEKPTEPTISTVGFITFLLENSSDASNTATFDIYDLSNVTTKTARVSLSNPSENSTLELLPTSVQYNGQNLVRSVNGVNADEQGNVQLVHLGNSGAITGKIEWFAFNEAPDGYLVCNGATVSRETYADLFAKIGTTFGSGDGSTTFTLPNLIDKFAQGSTTVGTVKSAGLPNIEGYLGIINHVPNTERGVFQKRAVSPNKSAAETANINTGLFFDASLSSSIYGNSSTVQPPALTLLPCIKY